MPGLVTKKKLELVPSLSDFKDRMSGVAAQSSIPNTLLDALLRLNSAIALRQQVARENAKYHNERNEGTVDVVTTNPNGTPKITRNVQIHNSKGLEETGPEKWYLEYQLTKPIFEGLSKVGKYGMSKLKGSTNNILADEMPYNLELYTLGYDDNVKLFLQKVPNSPYFKAGDTPYARDGHIGTERVWGTYDLSKINREMAHDIARRIEGYGYGLDEKLGSTPGTPRTAREYIQKQMDTPSKLVTGEGEYNKNIAGYYNPASGERVVVVSPYSATPQSIDSTNLHEGIMHGTDKLLDKLDSYTYWDGIIPIPLRLGYLDVARRIIPSLTKASRDPREVRSTLGEVRRRLYRAMVQGDKVDMKSIGNGDYVKANHGRFEKGIDDLDDEKLMEIIAYQNAYGNDMATTWLALVEDDPAIAKNFALDVRDLLKFAPAVTGVGSVGLVSKNKK